jgi:hypothetical protein
MSWLHRGSRPKTLYLYLAGVLLLVVIGFLPSEVETTYSWGGASLGIGLLFGLWAGSRFCRRALLLIGIATALGSLFLQDAHLEFVATAWSVLAIITTGLLMTPSMRAFTERASQMWMGGQVRHQGDETS